MKERKDSRRTRRTNGRRCRRQRRAKANDTISKKCVKQDTAQNGSVSKRAKRIGVIKRHLPGCEKEVLCIGIKNKEAKFSNRTRPEGWLTPSANQLLQTHINLVKKIRKFLPISDAVLEINKFAFMRLDNPNIQRCTKALYMAAQNNFNNISLETLNAAAEILGVKYERVKRR